MMRSFAGDSKTEVLIQQDDKTKCGRLKMLLMKEKRLLVAIFILIVAMNVPWGRYLLYPFMMFAIWCHEMCHGIAAIIVGGYTKSIDISPDGSGWCSWGLSGDTARKLRLSFVESAGYSGTAYAGAILLLFRKTAKGPQWGTIGIACLIFLSCATWMRGCQFGLLVMLPFGLVMLLCGIFLKGKGLGTIYTFLAATCCLNAMEYIHSNFTSSDVWDGDSENNASDAMDVAKHLGGTYFMWMLIWYIQSVVMLIIGVLFALPPPPEEDNNIELPTHFGYR